MNSSQVCSDLETKAFYLFDVLKKRDYLTAEHSLNVACIAKIAAASYIKVDLTSDKVFTAALLHDIGKIKMPDYIFKNHIISGPEERRIIMQHPVYTKTILENMDFDTDIIEAASQHHERVDGSGYPSGLKRTEISQTAKLLGIIDSFSAIMENRPYRKGKSLIIAIETLLKAKALYEANMLSKFIKNVNTIVSAADRELISFKGSHCQEDVTRSKRF